MVNSTSYFKYQMLHESEAKSRYNPVINKHCKKRLCCGILLFSIFQIIFHGRSVPDFSKQVFHIQSHLWVTSLKNDRMNQAKRVCLLFLRVRVLFSLFPSSFFKFTIFFSFFYPCRTSQSFMWKYLL